MCIEASVNHQPLEQSSILEVHRSRYFGRMGKDPKQEKARDANYMESSDKFLFWSLERV